ncbi:MAG: HAD family phosphatase [Clostridia bacterium]|nr:HAD family phosphatase [Clostridia bacterium]
MKLFEGKLILTDLDGTYLFDDHHISEENRAAARYFMDNGGLFTVATGRSKAGMEHFFPELEINAPAIIYNGSVIYDFARKADVLDTCVGTEGFRLCKALEARFPDAGIEVYADHIPYVAQDSFWTRRHFQNVKMPWNFCAAEDIPQPWLSLVVTGEERLPLMADFIETQFPGQFFLQFSSPHMLEIMHPQANKGAAARHLWELLGIEPENVYVAGDGTNDVQLLKSALHSCAPADACPEVLSIARHILPEYKKHAIAHLIACIEKGLL